MRNFWRFLEGLQDKLGKFDFDDPVLFHATQDYADEENLHHEIGPYVTRQIRREASKLINGWTFLRISLEADHFEGNIGDRTFFSIASFPINIGWIDNLFKDHGKDLNDHDKMLEASRHINMFVVDLKQVIPELEELTTLGINTDTIIKDTFSFLSHVQKYFSYSYQRVTKAQNKK